MGRLGTRCIPLLVVALALLPARGSEPGAPTEAAAAAVGGARSMIGKWVATQQLIFRERQDWQEAKEILLARIAATEREIAMLEAKLAESTGTLSDLGQRRADATSTERRLHESSQGLATTVSGLEAEVLRLCRYLPATVLEKVDPLRRRIPTAGAAARTSAAERLQNVLGILNEMNEANGKISLVTEVRPLSDDKPSEVKTVYVGLGQAYFLSPTGEAGVGRPSAEGWQWEAANELAPQITQTIEILENKAKPRFVPLPVTIR